MLGFRVSLTASPQVSLHRRCRAWPGGGTKLNTSSEVCVRVCSRDFRFSMSLFIGCWYIGSTTLQIAYNICKLSSRYFFTPLYLLSCCLRHLLMQLPRPVSATNAFVNSPTFQKPSLIPAPAKQQTSNARSLDFQNQMLCDPTSPETNSVTPIPQTSSISATLHKHTNNAWHVNPWNC